jgi:hypothetical protein
MDSIINQISRRQDVYDISVIQELLKEYGHYSELPTEYATLAATVIYRCNGDCKRTQSTKKLFDKADPYSHLIVECCYALQFHCPASYQYLKNLIDKIIEYMHTVMVAKGINYPGMGRILLEIIDAYRQPIYEDVFVGKIAIEDIVEKRFEIVSSMPEKLSNSYTIDGECDECCGPTIRYFGEPTRMCEKCEISY